MYQIFDEFLEKTDWVPYNDNEDRQFYKLLSRVIYDPRFSIEELGEYFTTHIFENETCEAQLQRNYLLDKAKAIHGYLEILDPR